MLSLRGLLTRYELAAKAHPVVVQISTGASVMTCGDTAAQLVVERQESVDTRRVAVGAAFNGFVASPVLFRLMVMVDRCLPGQQPLQIAKKALAHQTICAPLLGPSFVVWSSLVEALLAGQMHAARGREEACSRTLARLRQDFANIWGASYSFWQPANAINYGLVPQHLRIAFNTCAACVYNTFLTWIAHRRVGATGGHTIS